MVVAAVGLGKGRGREEGGRAISANSKTQKVRLVSNYQDKCNNKTYRTIVALGRSFAGVVLSNRAQLTYPGWFTFVGVLSRHTRAGSGGRRRIGGERGRVVDAKNGVG